MTAKHWQALQSHNDVRRAFYDDMRVASFRLTTSNPIALKSKEMILKSLECNGQLRKILPPEQNPELASHSQLTPTNVWLVARMGIEPIFQP